MTDTWLLQNLIAFSECGTLSAAAERLHISQPSVSRALMRLEDELGAPLLTRGKNTASLNENGRLAADYARRLLALEEEMTRSVRALDRSRRVISVGCCAPGPRMLLLPQLTSAFPDRTLAADGIVPDETALLTGLRAHEYRLIVLSHPVDDPALSCRFYTAERLFLSAPLPHPAAGFPEISFAEADGQSFVMYINVGVWEPLVRRLMPHSKFIRQEDEESVSTIIRTSSLLAFSTDITQNFLPSRRRGRMNVPFSDPEAVMKFYLVCRREDEKVFSGVLPQTE